MAEAPTTGLLLRLYLLVSPLLAPLARRHLARRVAQEKEDPVRWGEKLGQPTLPRPDGPLIWMHAVGVGEVLALPALVCAIRAKRPDIQVLVTSSSRTSAEALAANLPPGTLHQFLPLDAAPFVRAFLDHWRPDLAIWAERDIWPTLVMQTAQRGIPQLLVNARMNDASFLSKSRAGRLYRDLYARMAAVGVQDPATACHFGLLGVAAEKITLDGSLKSGADPLADQPDARAIWRDRLQGRRVWLAASTHPGDEGAVAEAHALLRRQDPDACLIVAPRDPGRATEVLEHLRAAGFAADLTGDDAAPASAAYVVPKIGQLGLWYRLADSAFIGGSIAPVGGHNPYEPARLNCAILHGPNIANFAADYAALHAANAARLVYSAAEMAEALVDPALLRQREPAAQAASRGRAALEHVAERLLSCLKGR